jgi:hypothetical protein
MSIATMGAMAVSGALQVRGRKRTTLRVGKVWYFGTSTYPGYAAFTFLRSKLGNAKQVCATSQHTRSIGRKSNAAGQGRSNPSPTGRDASQMPISIRHLAIIVAVALPACALGGCGSINEKLAAGISDVLPQWAGGLPPDAPPRPGTAKYDEFMRERERQRLEPAATREQAAQSPSSELDAVH